MRDINRIKPFLNKLQEFWEMNPDLRFGQIITMLIDRCDYDAFYYEENQWLEILEKFYNSKNEPKQEEYNSATLVSAEDWEGLYINNVLVKEGHSLNEGEDRVKCLQKLAKQYNFDLNKMNLMDLNDEEENMLNEIGHFPEDLRGFIEK